MSYKSKTNILPIVNFDLNSCTKCKKCDLSCPLVKWLGYKRINDAPYENCFKCGHCIAACPVNAIEHKEIKVQKSNIELPSEEQMYNQILYRRSIREYKRDKISKEHWNKLIDAVRYAPSSKNFQNIDLIIIESEAIIKKLSDAVLQMRLKLNKNFNIPILNTIYKRVLGKLTFEKTKKDIDLVNIQLSSRNRGQDPILFNAPGVMLFLGPKNEIMSKIDSVIAAQNVTILASSMKIGTCFNGLLTFAFSGMYPPIKKIIAIPQKYTVFSALTLGYEKYKFTSIPIKRERNTKFY